MRDHDLPQCDLVLQDGPGRNQGVDCYWENCAQDGDKAILNLQI